MSKELHIEHGYFIDLKKIDDNTYAATFPENLFTKLKPLTVMFSVKDDGLDIIGDGYTDFFKTADPVVAACIAKLKMLQICKRREISTSLCDPKMEKMFESINLKRQKRIIAEYIKWYEGKNFSYKNDINTINKLLGELDES